jgi:UDP-glucuronate decarboxylase
MAQDDGRVVSNFIVQALQNKNITIYGNGQQTRSFCYVDDLIDGFIKLMDTDSEITGPINLGNPQEFTIKELADKILSIIKSESILEQKPLPIDDPKQRRPDITKAQQLLGWQPAVSVDIGLVKTIDYFRSVI